MIRQIAVSLLVFAIVASALAADEKAKAATPNDQDDPIGRKLSERIAEVHDGGSSPLQPDKMILSVGPKVWFPRWARF